MSAPLFSVITPNFNSGPKLEATIASVASQESGLYEYLVIDGGSNDDSLERLRVHSQTLRWMSECDKGIYDAMNKGLRLATGQFLYFLGAGDLLRPNALRDIANLIPPPAGRLRMLYGDVHWHEQGGTYGGVFDAYRLACVNICHQAIFYERGIFDLLGEYSLRYPICSDHALNIQCFGRPEIQPIHFDLIVADFEGNGTSSKADWAFCADHPALVRRSLGLRAALRGAYHRSESLAWARWMGYHLRKPWRMLLGQLWRRLRRPSARLR